MTATIKVGDRVGWNSTRYIEVGTLIRRSIPDERLDRYRRERLAHEWLVRRDGIQRGVVMPEKDLTLLEEP